MGPATGAIITGAVNTGQGLLNFFGAKREGKKAREHDMRMAEYAYSKDLEMWNRQNQYNSPMEQMKRLRQAGLNPNLMYGKGTTGNASQLPKYQKPTPEHPFMPLQIGNLMDMYQNVQMKKQQIDNLKKIGDNLREDGITKAMANALLGYKLKLAPDKLSHDQSYFSARKRQFESETANKAAQAGITYQNFLWAKMRLKNMVETGTNIDKDEAWQRKLFMLFSDEIKSLINNAKSGFENKGSNPPDWINP